MADDRLPILYDDHATDVCVLLLFSIKCCQRQVSRWAQVGIFAIKPTHRKTNILWTGSEQNIHAF